MSDEHRGLTPGDPLRPGDGKRHPSGLPGFGDEGRHPSGLPASGDEKRDPSAPPTFGDTTVEEPQPHSSASSDFRGAQGPESFAPLGAEPTANFRTSENYGGAYAAPSGLVSQAPRYVLAGWGRRVGATIIDLLVVAFIAGLIGILMGVLGIGVVAVDPSAGTGGMLAGAAVSVVVFSIAVLLYAPLMMAKTNGRTLGRMAAGTRVVRASGEPMTLGVAMLREVVLKTLVVGFASNVTGGLAYFVDVLWPLWDKENRALHDFPVDTRTIMHSDSERT